MLKYIYSIGVRYKVQVVQKQLPKGNVVVSFSIQVVLEKW